MNIHIVENASEKDQALRIRTTVFVQEQHVPMEEEVDAYDEFAIHFLGLANKEPVATSRLRFAEDYGKLERIAVLPEYRGQSFGKQLIHFMEKTILDHDYSIAKLNAQTHAEEFYKRLGYQTISDTFLDAGIPHIAMIKSLS